MDCNTPGLPVSHHPPEFAYLELKKPSNLKMPMSSNKQKRLLSIAKGPGKKPPNKTKNFLTIISQLQSNTIEKTAAPPPIMQAKTERSLDFHTHDAVRDIPKSLLGWCQRSQ